MYIKKKTYLHLAQIQNLVLEQDNWTESELIDILHKYLKSIGSKYGTSNTNYYVVGAILASCTIIENEYDHVNVSFLSAYDIISNFDMYLEAFKSGKYV